MSTIRALPLLAALVALAAATTQPAEAQSTFTAQCSQAQVVASGAQETCLATAQAAVSAQPIIGLLFAGGSPTVGYGAGGLRLGLAPRASAGARINMVPVALPDIVSTPSTPGEADGTFESVLTGLILDASITLANGVDISPNYGGIGGISLIAATSFVPFTAADGEIDQSNFAYGLGARVQLLRESFVAPAVAITVMRRRLDNTIYGNICPTGGIPVENPDPNEPRIEGCQRSGDPGQVAFDLTNWSGRATVSKNYYGLAGLLGLGYDRFASDVNLGVRAPAPEAGGITRLFRIQDVGLDSSSWVMFGNASYNLLVASITAEAGWQQGGSPIDGFSDIGSDFDPKGGTWFGGVGVRIAL